jgi:hypothetical protein
MGGFIIEDFLKICGNNFFPMVLSVYLIFKLDQLISNLVKTQKDFSDKIILEIQAINKNILDLRADQAKFSNI